MSSLIKTPSNRPHTLVFTRMATDPETGARRQEKRYLYFRKSEWTRKALLDLKRDLDTRFKAGTFDPWRDRLAVDRAPAVNSIAELIARYVAVKSATDWRTYSAKRYASIFRQLQASLAGVHLLDLNAEHLAAYVNREGISYGTRKSQRTALVTFARWVNAEGFLAVQLDLKAIRIWRRDDAQEETINYLSEAEIQTLLRYIVRKVRTDVGGRGGQTHARNVLWLVDFINWQRLTGMRISETLSLRTSSINPHTWHVTIGDERFTTKSGRRQVLPIGEVPRLVHIARRLLRRAQPGGYLWAHRNSEYVTKVFRTYVRQALPNRTGINVHTLRHTCAIELLRRGVNLYFVSRWLRHADISTTQRYADVVGLDLSRAVGDAFAS